jgi:hypothetical protein
MWKVEAGKIQCLEKVKLDGAPVYAAHAQPAECGLTSRAPHLGMRTVPSIFAEGGGFIAD